MNNKTLLGLLLIASVLFAGCAASTGNTTQPAAIYHPKLPQGIATMAAAEQELAILMKKAYSVSYGKNSRFPDVNALRRFIENKEGELGTATNCDYWGTGNIECSLAGIGVSGGRLAVPLFPIYFDELAGSPIEVGITTVGGRLDHYVLDGLPHKISFHFAVEEAADRPTAHKVADLLFFIQQNWASLQQEKLAAFEKKAILYRSLRAKPEMGEEQRKLIVQANAFNQQRNYDKAISLYQKAIGVDPVSYPPAYFNLALLSAQENHFSTAIFRMKQYLMLVPDAKDARSAQDKIYEWENP